MAREKPRDKDSLLYRIARNPNSPTGYVELANVLCESSSTMHVALADGRVLDAMGLCAAAIAADATYTPAYTSLMHAMDAAAAADPTGVVAVSLGEKRLINPKDVAAYGLSVLPDDPELLHAYSRALESAGTQREQ